MRLKKFSRVVFALTVLFAASQVSAGVTPELKTLVTKLGLSVENLNETPVNGLYELQSGTQIYYISSDGKYLLSGEMINMLTKENLTERRLKGIRKDSLSKVSDEQMIIFPAEKPEHVITVFTDIDCGYCRKLHSEMQQYNDQGISIKYMFYPRTGLGTPSYNTAVSVWCDKDRQQAMTRAKAGEDLQNLSCVNPVARHFMLGHELGINGTPAIITEGGDLMPGYLPPKMMKMQLDKLRAGEAKKVSSK